MRDTIDMARESKLDIYGLGFPHDQFMERVKAFEAFVRADEREACAKVCDELHWPWHMGDNSGPKECANAIRNRGNT
jgi:hypothetical protein